LPEIFRRFRWHDLEIGPPRGLVAIAGQLWLWQTSSGACAERSIWRRNARSDQPGGLICGTIGGPQKL
jgi:hypothetical protein